MILSHAEEAMSEAGARILHLQCRTGNDQARRFYEKHGWQVAEEVLIPDAIRREGEPPPSIWKMVKGIS